MKKIIGLTLVLALAFQCFSKLGLLTFYHFYKEYITEKYCENKDQPQLQCKGTCFLKKGLEKEDNNPENTSETIKQVEIPAFIISSYFKQPIILTKLDNIFPEVQYSYSFLYTSNPFQPPKGN